MRKVELKDWLDVLFKAWTAAIATAALIAAIRKEKTAERRKPSKPKRKR